MVLGFNLLFILYLLFILNLWLKESVGLFRFFYSCRLYEMDRESDWFIHLMLSDMLSLRAVQEVVAKGDGSMFPLSNWFDWFHFRLFLHFSDFVL